jgi:hypothetical protein
MPLLPPVTMATFPLSASVAIGHLLSLSLFSLCDEGSAVLPAGAPHGIYFRQRVLLSSS